MANKSERNKKTEAKTKHYAHKHAENRRGSGTMSHVLIFVLPCFAAIALAIAGMIYEAHKVPAIWLVFGATVFTALAACLYWQETVISEEKNPPFAADIIFLASGPERDNTQVFAEYNDLLTPIPVLLNLSIVNRQPVPATISKFTVDIKLKDKSWLSSTKWLKTVSIPEQMPTVWVNPPPERAMHLVFDGNRLEAIFRSRPLQPNETIVGWVLLDVPVEFDSAPRPLVFRISLKDTAGKSFTAEDSGPIGKDINITTPYGFHVTTPVDLGGRQIRHLADGQIP